jgi:hypothetical protein
MGNQRTVAARVRRKVVGHERGWSWGFVEVVMECGHSQSYRSGNAPSKTATCRVCTKAAELEGG